MKRAQGIDISHNQKKYIQQDHHDFVIVKCSDGYALDDRFEEHLDSITGIPVGAYHYLRYNVSVELQVQTTLEAIDGQGVAFVACDFERTYNVKSKKFALDCYQYILAMLKQQPAPVLLYSSWSIIQEWMFQQGVFWARHYPYLWIAQWPYNGWNDRMYEVPDTVHGWQPALPAGVDDWHFWQYSADGNRKGPENGINKEYMFSATPSVDMNVFNGTAEDLHKWLEWESEEKPEPTPPVVVTNRAAVIDECITALQALK